MGKNQNAGAYLVNTNDNISTAVKFPIDGSFNRQFIDISELDLKTMDMKYKDAKDLIQEYNKGITITDNFHDVDLKATTMNQYNPIFAYEYDQLKQLFNRLRHFAELRLYNKKKNNKVSLEETEEMNYYRYELLRALIEHNKQYVTSYDCTIGENVKNKINQIGSAHMITNNVLSDFALRNTLSGYTQLRNLFIEYANYLNEIAIYNSQRKLDNLANNQFEKLYQYDSFSLFEDYDQPISIKH